MTRQDDVHDEFRPLIARLRADRPVATPLELDAAKQRVLARAAAPSRQGRTGELMRSRIAILATLVLGLMFSTTGAGLAISGFTSDDQASVAQYPTPQPGGTTPAAPAPAAPVLPGGGVQGEQNEQPSSPAGGVEGATGVQPSQQVEATNAAGGNTLPFTGFAAVPVLLLGVGLFGAGLMMRKGAQRQD
jgi:hypothetical protein